MLKFFAPVESKEHCHIRGSTRGTHLKNIKARVDTHWKTKLSHRSIVTHTSSAKVSSSVTVNVRKMVLTKETEKSKSGKLLNKMDRLAQSKRQNISSPPRRKRIVVTKAKAKESEMDSVASTKAIKNAPVSQSTLRPPTFCSYSNGLGVSILKIKYGK